MNAGAADRNGVLVCAYGNDFVGSQGRAQTARFVEHCPNFKLYETRADAANALCGCPPETAQKLGLLKQHDLADTSFALKMHGCGSFAVGVVDVFVSIVLQSV